LPLGAATSATTREILAAKGGTMGEKGCPVILLTWRLYSRHYGSFTQIYDMGPTALLPLRRKACYVAPTKLTYFWKIFEFYYYKIYSLTCFFFTRNIFREIYIQYLPECGSFGSEHV